MRRRQSPDTERSGVEWDDSIVTGAKDPGASGSMDGYMAWMDI